jgi:alpha-tubulin suppressor-like RCC1 family protein
VSDAAASTDSAPSGDAPSGSEGGPACVIARSMTVLNDAVSVVAGGEHTCALRGDGTLVCWGQNSAGQLGMAPTVMSASPRPVLVQFPIDAGAVSIAKLALGGFATYAIDTEQRLWTWGGNSHGELGIGAIDTAPHPVPALITLGNDPTAKVRAVAASFNAACAIDTTGGLYCWGDPSTLDALVDGGSAGPAHPSAPALQQLGPGLLAGGVSGRQLCFVDDTGALAACWGGTLAHVLLADAGNGGPGLNTAAAPALQAAGVAFPLHDLQFGGAVNYYGCLLDATGTIYCWGELPPFNGTTFSPGKPVPISFGGGVTNIGGGNSRVCSVTASGGRAYCLGSNFAAALGNGTLIGATEPLLPIDGGTATFAPVVTADGGALSGVTGISAGYNHTCAVEQGPCGADGGGTVVCWGFNPDGELGSEAGVVTPADGYLVSPVAVPVLAPAP